MGWSSELGSLRGMSVETMAAVTVEKMAVLSADGTVVRTACCMVVVKVGLWVASMAAWLACWRAGWKGENWASMRVGLREMRKVVYSVESLDLMMAALLVELTVAVRVVN